MNEKKGTTGMVAYIALLMVAGASLWHREDSFGAGPNFQADAFSSRTFVSEPLSHNEGTLYGKTVRIEFSGRTYEARIISEVPAFESPVVQY